MTTCDIGAELAALAAGRWSERFTSGSLPPQAATELLGPTTLGRLLSHPLVRYPQVRVALSGKAVQPSHFVEERRIGTQTVADGVDSRRVAQLLTRGATVTLDSLEYLLDPISAICTRLSDELGLSATATAYVTPPGQRGLSPHTDEEDVFVLQTFGTKRWLIDPAQRQRIATASGFVMNAGLERVTPRVLRPGEMFFMPAGTPHVATAEHDLSIHVTFSVERPRRHTALLEAVARLTSETPELRTLQSWSFSPAELVGHIEAIESELRRTPDRVRSREGFSSFEQWGELFRGAGSAGLADGIELTESADGSFRIDGFSIRARGQVAAFLRELRDTQRVPLARVVDPELTELLFQLIGREVVTVRGG